MTYYYCRGCERYCHDNRIGKHEEGCESPWTIYSQDSDLINHPKHYNSSPAHCDCGRKIECIDITRHMGFNLGNALKYIWRSEHKNGSEDIRKAIWYLNDYLLKLSTSSVDKSVNKVC